MEPHNRTMGRGEVSESIGAMAIGKYQLFASLGRGGMADVFLAVARGPMGFNKLTVIKRLRADHAKDPAFANMLLDEARLAARLSHPNVVHTYEVGEDAGAYFIAMEYLEGQPLVRVFKSMTNGAEKLPPPLAARVIADALSGLHYAHELRDYDGKALGIIHRDVSPHNIFVTYDGVVKLMDFGIAKAASSATQTEVGVLKGKLAYMAPEQAKGDPVDRRADIFAMGIVLWELITCERLFAGGAAAATLHKLLAQPIPRLSEKIPGIDPRLEAVVAKALEKDPRQRYQTAQEMRTGLEDYIAASGASPRQEEIGRRMNDFFEDTRQNAHKQIQVHMAQLSLATTTGELMALNASALKSVRAEPTPSGRNLLRLSMTDGSGSTGSAAVPPASSPSLPGEAQPQKKRGAILWGGIVALIILAAVLFVTFHSPGAPYATEPQGSGAPATAANAVTPAAPVLDPSTPVALASASSATAAQGVPAAAVAAAAPTTPGTGEPAAVVPSPVVPSPSPSPPSHHDHSGSRGSVAAPAPKPAPASAPAAPPPAPSPADTGTGFLTLDTYPWTRVSENGRALGVTPLVHVPLSAGTHLLTLENPEQGLKQQYPVTLKADESVSRRLGLK